MVVVHRPRGSVARSTGLIINDLQRLPAPLIRPPPLAHGLPYRQRLLAAPGASVISIRLVKLLKTTKPTAGKAVQVLENLGVLVEKSGKQRD